MLSVRELMSTDLVTVGPDLSLRDLIELMVREQITGVPVIEGKRTVGVVSLGDVVAFLAARPGVPTERGAPVEPALDEDEEDRSGAEGGEVAGEDEAAAAYFADSWSDAGAAVVERFAAPGSPEWDQLGEHTVREAMTRQLLTIRPSDSAVEAARRMRDARAHRLLVMEGKALLGIVTTMDLSAAVAEQGLGGRGPRRH